GFAPSPSMNATDDCAQKRTNQHCSNQHIVFHTSPVLFRARRAAHRLPLSSSGSLANIRSNPPRLIFGEQLGGRFGGPVHSRNKHKRAPVRCGRTRHNTRIVTQQTGAAESGVSSGSHKRIGPTRETTIWFHHWRNEGAKRAGTTMRVGSQKHKPSDWPYAMEQIARELRKIYRRPERLPRRLRALFRRARSKTAATGRN